MSFFKNLAGATGSGNKSGSEEGNAETLTEANTTPGRRKTGGTNFPRGRRQGMRNENAGKLPRGKCSGKKRMMGINSELPESEERGQIASG